MSKKNIILSFAFIGLLIQGAFASDIKKEVEEFDLNSILYIEDEEVIDLGFNTADYLPEDFNPNTYYFNLNWVEYVDESKVENVEVENNLPSEFDAYSNPEGIEGVNYIDLNDEIVIGFNTKQYLPKGFNAFK
ncbi:hypothetical protein JQC67_06000 [Aurantibacter crassamenti]|uniref:hypothetical protein n=1 Tax=Aurantibacter crassamenti TaxID=1837375 RepID=UPI00193AD52C|nr:hypothetical protein [Aurantibacter crassamenti]MBM1105690.1 hypothetical protein [Aurantibacter crassamenti]